MRAADTLDDQIDARIVDDGAGVGGKERRIDCGRARFVRIGNRDRLQLVAHAAAPLDRVTFRKQSLRDRRADRAASE